MKNILTNGVVILLIVAIFYIVFLRECKKSEPCPPDGYVLIEQGCWDSILILANMPPVIKIKKEIIKGKTVYIDRPFPVPVVDPKDSTVSNFSDSLVNEKINVWYDFRLRGELLDRQWHYVPIVTNITLTKTVYVPKIVEKEVQVIKNGYYLSGILGGRAAMPIMYGASFDLVTDKGNLYGMQFQRMGLQNFYSFRIGARIRVK